MALPVLDGNQSATTLSSVVTGGEHIVAHSVVSLGANAIANITSAVSGVAISGTVTANLANVVTTDYYWGEDAIKVTGPNAQGILVAGVDQGGNPANVYEGGAIPVRGVDELNVPISGTVTVGNVAGFNIPTHDFKSFDYTGSNLTQIAYKTGGASGTTVGILTLAYDGNGNLTSMTKS